jgi:phosphatidylglycerophosphate synthase
MVPPAATLVGWLSGVAMLAALLDAVDGPLARRQGLASTLGARFDMEVDAFLIVVLSLLCWQWGKAGLWVVLAGALRYLFIAAAWCWAWLAVPLPPSKRRQSICVVQIVSLIVCFWPAVAPPWSAMIAGLGLLLLITSFARDIHWLAGASR